MPKRKVDVLGVDLWPGTRLVRFTLESGLTWTAKVLWIDEATETEPLELVLEAQDKGVRVLTLTDTYWRLGTVRHVGGEIVQQVELLTRSQTRRNPLEQLLRLK